MKLFTNSQINTYQEKEKRLPLKPSKHIIKLAKPEKSKQFQSIDSTELLGHESPTV